MKSSLPTVPKKGWAHEASKGVYILHRWFVLRIERVFARLTVIVCRTVRKCRQKTRILRHLLSSSASRILWGMSSLRVPRLFGRLMAEEELLIVKLGLKAPGCPELWVNWVSWSKNESSFIGLWRHRTWRHRPAGHSKWKGSIQTIWLWSFISIGVLAGESETDLCGPI